MKLKNTYYKDVFFDDWCGGVITIDAWVNSFIYFGRHIVLGFNHHALDIYIFYFKIDCIFEILLAILLCAIFIYFLRSETKQTYWRFAPENRNCNGV